MSQYGYKVHKASDRTKLNSTDGCR